MEVGSPEAQHHLCKRAMVRYYLIWDEPKQRVKASNAKIVLNDPDEDDGWWDEDTQYQEHHEHKHGHQHHQGSEDQEARPHRRRPRMFMGKDDEDARIVI